MMKFIIQVWLFTISYYVHACECDFVLEKFNNQKYLEITEIDNDLINNLIIKSVIYYWGLGVEINHNAAEDILKTIDQSEIESFIEHLNSKAVNGCNVANVILGILYLEGNIFKIKKSFIKSKSKFLQDANNPISILGLSAIHYENNKINQARKKIKKLIENKINDPLSIAIMFESGFIFKKNINEAFYWYKIAGDSGDVNAYGTIGYMYATGHGVEKDSKKANYWFKLQDNNLINNQDQPIPLIDSIINSDDK